VENLKSFITLGWANVAIAPSEIAPQALGTGNKGYMPPFRVPYRPPEFSWCDVLLVKYCEGQMAS
jgi:hypothetical protein